MTKKQFMNEYHKRKEENKFVDLSVFLGNSFEKGKITFPVFMDVIVNTPSKIWDKYSKYPKNQTIYLSGHNETIRISRDGKKSDFNFEVAQKVLEKFDDDGNYTVEAGQKKKPGGTLIGPWREFDHKRGLKFLKDKKYFSRVMRDWPMNIEAVQEISKEIRAKAKKIPTKKLKLK